MRIGVDGACWSNERGYGRFAREIFAEMVRLAPQHLFVCFVDDASARHAPASANVRQVNVSTATSAALAASASGYRPPGDILAMSRAVWKEDLDVFFSPSVYSYFPLPPRMRAVVTVHDAIAERFPKLTFSSTRARLFWALKMKLALLQARRILTVSEYAAEDVKRVHGVSPSRIDIALEAPASVFHPRDAGMVRDVAARVGIPESALWFIYVGGFSPHKNVPAIIRAHAALAAKSKAAKPHLLLVGEIDEQIFLDDLSAIRAEVARLGAQDLVHWTGYINDEDLSALATGAIALLLPSAAEGFGLPAVEAAACATPVIATTESPLPHLLRDGGLFVAPGDEAALLDSMTFLASDDVARNAMGAVAQTRARALTWEGAARSALASLEAAAA